MEEHNDRWIEAYVSVKYLDVPMNANVITSHVIYNVKREEDIFLGLKGRILPHDNGYMIKEEVMKDSESVKFGVIGLMIAVITFLPSSRGLIDIKRV